MVNNIEIMEPINMGHRLLELMTEGEGEYYRGWSRGVWKKLWKGSLWEVEGSIINSFIEV